MESTVCLAARCWHSPKTTQQRCREEWGDLAVFDENIWGHVNFIVQIESFQNNYVFKFYKQLNVYYYPLFSFCVIICSSERSDMERDELYYNTYLSC